MCPWKLLALLPAILLAGCPDDTVVPELPDASASAKDATAFPADASPVAPDAATDAAAGADDATTGGDDAATGEDAQVPPEDGGLPIEPDAGWAPGPIGGACAGNADCLSNVCIPPSAGWPEGYCALAGCDLASAETSCLPYGGDGFCLTSGATSYCLDRCDPAATPTGCRAGYDCNTYGAASVCEPTPFCGDGKVTSPEECEPPNTATCDADCRGTGADPTGAACTDASSCAGNGCTTDWPGGYCTELGCDPASPDTSCAAVGGGICLGSPGAGACYQACDPDATPTGCRGGYDCNTYGTASVCEPTPVCGDGLVTFPEECEPPNTTTCDANCRGLGTGLTGAPCTEAGACAGLACLAAWPGGYCTQSGCDLADPDASCAAGGGTCRDVAGQASCLQTCDPAASPTGCRTGYACNTYGVTSVCEPVPACGDGVVTAPEQCEPPGTPTCDANCMVTGVDPTGTPCTSEATCLGDYCIASWPGGYCSQIDCDPAAPDTSCAAVGGGVCLDVGGAGICFQACDPAATPSDCRAGYLCSARGAASVCEPAPVCGDGVVVAPEQCEPPGTPTCDASCMTRTIGAIGASCVGAGDCASNYCIAAADGYPGGYCSYAGCDLAAPATACDAFGPPGTAACIDVDTTGTSPYGLCFDLCDPAAPDCRAKYGCIARSAVSVCEPAQLQAVGRPCASAADCAADTCLGAADAWPAVGYCAQSGCDLANPTTSCPAGSSCADIAATGTPRPMCLDTCSAGPSDPCAAGFRCVKHGNLRLCEP